MEKFNLLGVNIASINKEDALDTVRDFLNDGRQHYIVTPNPEFLIAAGKDEEFFYILNKADLSISDGAGLVLAGRIMGEKLNRITGVDMTYKICRLAEETGRSVYLLGGEGSVAEEAKSKLVLKFPNLKIVGAEAGLTVGGWEIKAGKLVRGSSDNADLLRRINTARPDILFVAFGHPRQEKWIYHNLSQIPSVRIAMGIGGGLDFISGRVKRAPKIFQALYLEWLWRLILEPWRAKRIYDAVIRFPLKFIVWKYLLPFLYRPNVACFLYKREGGRFKVFIVKRSQEQNHWQLPQGGTDGESITKAGERELREETGTTKFMIKKTVKNVFRYEFGEGEGKYKTNKHIGYKGQKQSLCIALFVGEDDQIKINFWDHDDWRWVDSERLSDEVFSARKEATKIFLREFKKFIDNEHKKH